MWCGPSFRGMMHEFIFAVNDKGKPCFSLSPNNNVPPINNLFVEKEWYFQDGVAHHLLNTVTQPVTVFLDIGLGTGKEQVRHPSFPYSLLMWYSIAKCVL
jgi:hypothetical protein